MTEELRANEHLQKFVRVAITVRSVPRRRFWPTKGFMRTGWAILFKRSVSLVPMPRFLECTVFIIVIYAFALFCVCVCVVIV